MVININHLFTIFCHGKIILTFSLKIMKFTFQPVRVRIVYLFKIEALSHINSFAVLTSRKVRNAYPTWLLLYGAMLAGFAP